MIVIRWGPAWSDPETGSYHVEMFWSRLGTRTDWWQTKVLPPSCTPCMCGDQDDTREYQSTICESLFYHTHIILLLHLRQNKLFCMIYMSDIFLSFSILVYHQTCPIKMPFCIFFFFQCEVHVCNVLSNMTIMHYMQKKCDPNSRAASIRSCQSKVWTLTFT